MSSSPKIVVLKTREILYTLILLFFVILLIVCLFLMFAPKKADSGQPQSVTSAATYIPGIYTAPVTLGKDTMNMEVTVDASEIRAIPPRELKRSHHSLLSARVALSGKDYGSDSGNTIS